MKVLWFTNSPSMAEDSVRKSPSNGGWIEALEKEMREKVELSIAFYYSDDSNNIKSGKTTYYPICKRKSDSIRSKIDFRIFKKLEPASDLEKFKSVIEKVNPDIIHIHGTELPFGLVQTLTKIPVVISIQGILTVYEHKYFSGIPYFDVIKYTSAKKRAFFTSEYTRFKRFKKEASREKRIYKMSKHFIGRTDWDRRVTKVLSPTANYYHNDEILKDNFYEGVWNNQISDTMRLHTTTGTNLYKGLETLIYTANLLDKINFKYKWTVAGVDKNDDIVKIALKKNKTPLSPNIEFLGKVFDSVIKENIINCNVYVCISHIENSPNSLCEALILGAPCISTCAGGISKFIQNGETGLLIQDGDPYSMAGTIIEVRDNYQDAIELGRKARKEAIRRHDKGKISSDLIDIYLKILKANTNAPSPRNNSFIQFN